MSSTGRSGAKTGPPAPDRGDRRAGRRACSPAGSLLGADRVRRDDGRSGASGRAGSTQPATSHAATSGPASRRPRRRSRRPTRPGRSPSRRSGDTMLGTTAEPAPSPGTYFDGVKSAITGRRRVREPGGHAHRPDVGQVRDAAGRHLLRVPSCRRPTPGTSSRPGSRSMSNGNNHAFDFWQAGLDDTVAALDRVGLAHTGRTTEITYVDVRGHDASRSSASAPTRTPAPLNDFTGRAAADPQGRRQGRPRGGRDARRRRGLRRART